GLSAAAATKGLFGLSLVGSALGAYWLGATLALRSPTGAGLAAALLYTLVPYRLATVYHRGALAEALGPALAPLVVRSAVRAGRGWRGVGWLALASGALALTHTIAAVITLPLAGLLGLSVCLPRPKAVPLLRLAVGLGLGLALSAIYWLPAYREQDTVHLE